jgi:hypothetical protein
MPKKYKFNFTKSRDMRDWREHFLLHVMSEKTKSAPKEFESIFNLAKSRNEDGDLILEVEVKINGVDVPFDSFIKHLDFENEVAVLVPAFRQVENRLELLGS